MNSNTIVLKRTGGGHFEEGTLGTAALPGECVTLQADGDYDRCTPAVAAALKAGLIIVVEDALQGKTVLDAYAAGDWARFYIPQPGDEIQVLVATGEDIDVGDKLVMIGTGNAKFEEAAGTEARFVLEALEDSGVALAADTLLAARVL